MKCTARRHYRADEEPEREYVSPEAYAEVDCCRFCGWSDHVKSDCPNRPRQKGLTDITTMVGRRKKVAA